MPTLLSINGQPLSFGGAALSWPDAVPDVTAPSLAYSTLTATGATTATGTVTTYEADGTVYAYISTSGTPPIAATVKANGTSQAGGSAGVKTFNFTGLTPETLYSVYYVQTDAAGNDSDVANAADTTDAAEEPAGFGYIWPTVTVESDPETTTGYRWKVRTPIGSGSYTTVKTTTPSVAIGTELAATTYHETYNTQFDGIVVAYNGTGESSITYAPFQFWTAPSSVAPVLTAAAIADTSNVGLTWTFTPNPANGGFIIFRDAVEIARVAAAIRTYTDETSAAVTAYDYTVQPYNSNPDIEGTVRTDSLGVLSDVETVTTEEEPAPVGVSDTFTAANDTAIHGRTPSPTTAGGNWATLTGSSANQTIQGNQAELVYVSESEIAVVESYVSDCNISATITVGAAGAFALIFRATDENNMYQWIVGTSGVALFKRVAGVDTALGYNPEPLTPGVSYTVGVTMSGSSIICSLNGFDQAAGTVTESFNISGTKHGIASLAATSTVDDFLITPP